MALRIPAIALAMALSACAGRARPLPPLFPLSTSWTVTLEGPIAGPMAADLTRAYVHTRDGAVLAVGLADGATAWRAEPGPGLLGGGPAGLVLRQADGTVSGLDPETGSVRWTTPSAVAGDLPPVLDGDRVLLAGDGVAVLEASSGRVLWAVAGGPAVSAPPAAAEGRVVVGEADGTVRCRDAGTGRSLWTYRAGGPLTAAPVIGQGRVLVATGGREFLALHLEDGDRDWRWKVGADVQWPAAVAGDLVLFASHEDVLYAVKARGGNMVWRAPLPSRPLSPPLVTAGGVLVACYGARPEENLFVGFDLRNGQRLGELRTPAELAAPPLVSGGRLVLGLLDRRLLALELPPPPAPVSLTTPAGFVTD